MTEKRFTINREDECIDDAKEEMFIDFNDRIDFYKLCEVLNELSDENEKLKSENDSYKNMFFEIVETALTDTNCKELYCKGILDIFDKANSLNQAREMIKEHLK